METFKMLRLEQKLIKTFIPIIALLACVHIALLLFGIDEIWTEVFHESVGCAMLLIAANVFKLCMRFKLLIFYKFAVEMCIIFQRGMCIFGENVTIIRLIMLIIGFVLIIALHK